MFDWTSIIIGAVIGAVITAVGVIVTILYTRKSSRRRKVLLFTNSQSNVVSGLNQTLPGLAPLELRYGGTTIPAASVARVILWNAGSEAITEEALASDNRLRLVMPKDSVALDVRIVDRMDGAIGPRVLPADSETVPAQGATNWLISFKCLNAGHGFALQVVHSGGPEQAPGLAGTLQDVEGPTYVLPYRRFMQQGGPFFAFIMIGLLAAVLLDPFPKGSNEGFYFLIFVFFLFMMIPILLLRRWGSNLWWTPPGKLKQFASPPIPLPPRRR